MSPMGLCQKLVRSVDPGFDKVVLKYDSGTELIDDE